MYSWRDREVVMDILAEISGNRVNYGVNTMGGVRRDISPEKMADIAKAVDLLEERTKYYIKLATEETTIIKRLSGVGVVTHADAIRLGAVGPTARASGVNRDVRRDDPYLAYPELEFDVIIDDHNDVYGRAVVRLKELMQSYRIIRQVLKKMPDGPITVKAPRRVPAGEAISYYEAPRGEDFHYVKANGTEKPERVKLRAPTLANVQAVAHMLKDGYLADMPIVIAAIDPCFSCTDRTTMIRGKGPSGKTWMWDELRRHGIQWHQKRGVNFAALNKKLTRQMA
jgi:NADH-quinone oxidoreductase subunit D